ncbi:MAG: hypothetical protein P4L22_07190 [Candidatus Babeliales bacterium]|nr:hypothetical protein [Candidatus Babeliales bacterium]
MIKKVLVFLSFFVLPIIASEAINPSQNIVLQCKNVFNRLNINEKTLVQKWAFDKVVAYGELYKMGCRNSQMFGSQFYRQYTQNEIAYLKKMPASVLTVIQQIRNLGQGFYKNSLNSRIQVHVPNNMFYDAIYNKAMLDAFNDLYCLYCSLKIMIDNNMLMPSKL